MFIYCRLLSNHIESKLQDGPWWNWGWYNSGYVGKIKYCGNTQSPIVCFTSMFLGKQNKVWKGIHFSPVCSRQRTRPVRIQQSFCVPFTGWIGTCEMQILFFAWRYIIYIYYCYIALLFRLVCGCVVLLRFLQIVDSYCFNLPERWFVLLWMVVSGLPERWFLLLFIVLPAIVVSCLPEEWFLLLQP